MIKLEYNDVIKNFHLEDISDIVYKDKFSVNRESYFGKYYKDDSTSDNMISDIYCFIESNHSKEFADYLILELEGHCFDTNGDLFRKAHNLVKDNCWDYPQEARILSARGWDPTPTLHISSSFYEYNVKTSNSRDVKNMSTKLTFKIRGYNYRINSHDNHIIKINDKIVDILDFRNHICNLGKLQESNNVVISTNNQSPDGQLINKINELQEELNLSNKKYLHLQETINNNKSSEINSIIENISETMDNKLSELNNVNLSIDSKLESEILTLKTDNSKLKQSKIELEGLLEEYKVKVHNNVELGKVFEESVEIFQCIDIAINEMFDGDELERRLYVQNLDLSKKEMFDEIRRLLRVCNWSEVDLTDIKNKIYELRDVKVELESFEKEESINIPTWLDRIKLFKFGN